MDGGGKKKGREGREGRGRERGKKEGREEDTEKKGKITPGIKQSTEKYMSKRHNFPKFVNRKNYVLKW
jgi:hypothetical protein